MKAYQLNGTSHVPWYYDMNLEDTNWIITSSFMIFTMQTGFGMLESGCVSIKNEVNIMMKNVVDIVLGGLTYWIFGYAIQFGRSPMNNGFLSLGDFFIDPSLDDPMKGAIYAAFIFQLSFATTATTIVSGAMAERCNFKAYCVFSFFNTIIYSVPAGWVWSENGFLRKMGAVDIAGSGPVHLIGGSAAFAAALMLGPRLGRYDNGRRALPLGSPVNAVMGLFVLWWGWLAFNSGSTYGLSGEKWQYAARAAVMTMMSSFGGGTVSILFSLLKHERRIEVLDIINGILGSLVSVTAGCFLYKSWEALLIGTIGAILVCTAMPLFDWAGIDDPVGASAVHGIGGIWGVLAVGLFAEDPHPLNTTHGLVGLVNGGGWYLLGIQSLCCLCLASWGIFSCMTLLWIINKIILIRMEVHIELLGADLTEHHVKHPQVGVSRALSALRPCLDMNNVEDLINVGLNPGHDVNLNIMKSLSRKRRYKLSKIFTDITGKRNFGINSRWNLIPNGKKIRDKILKRTNNKKKAEKAFIQPNLSPLSVTNLKNIDNPLPWIN
ncbi:putative ammonium transporter 2 [Onthophagus taurus]|uniref:putative ammonium transporter 2 n=1 Tax=Onthophagus taurus TaxID=166361 RepID=UPI000C207382|nr:putative ammonium transporter 2 [Onthophagus taurus]